MSTDLLKQIDDLVSSKTFNLEALDGIKKIKDDLNATLLEVESLRRLKVTLSEEIDNLKKANKDNGERIQELNQLVLSRQKQVDDGREAVCQKLVAEAKADAYKDALYVVFKPNAVREVIQRNHAVVVPSGNSSYIQSVSNQDMVVREDA
jgi:predicted  nucleic acid-binding Zn-ribbon protein